LGKEIVQNLLVIRFANLIFEPIWNRANISNVQITFKEDIGVEGRGGYFDQYGIIRDVMQNHLLQVVALITMEPPVTYNAEDIRDEKVKALRAILPIREEDVVIGQYTKKKVGDKVYPGYLDDPTVPKGSRTPTFAAAVLHVRNRRWAGVPFLLRCGKGVDERLGEIRIQFHPIPANIFGEEHLIQPNELILRIQPDEAINLRIMNKAPGLDLRIDRSNLDLKYLSKFSDARIPDAYERLLLDSVKGDKGLFIRNDELAVAWDIFTPMLHKLEEKKVQPEQYPFLSRGPASADYLAAKYGVKFSED